MDAPNLATQMVMLAMWALRLVIGLALSFGCIVVVDKWWLRGFDTATELRKGNYAVAVLVGILVYSVLHGI